MYIKTDKGQTETERQRCRRVNPLTFDNYALKFIPENPESLFIHYQPGQRNQADLFLSRQRQNKNTSESVHMPDATWRFARLLVSKLSSSSLVAMLHVVNTTLFNCIPEITFLRRRAGPTDGRPGGRTNASTDGRTRPLIAMLHRI